MTFVVLTFLALTQAEVDVPSTVDPLSRLLPTLGQRAGMKLFAGESVRDDVVGIASPKRPIKALMDGIAEAVNGTWEERKEGWVLLRTKAQEAQDEAKDTAVRAKWIREALARTILKEPFDSTRAKGLAAYRHEFKTADQSDEKEYSQLDSMNGRSPLGRFTRRLIEAIGIDTLAEIPTGKRIVFSTRPNRLQRRLEAKKLEVPIATFCAEQNLYAEAVSGTGEPTNEAVMTYISGFDFVQKVPAQWDRVLVVVETFNPFQTYLTVDLVDKDGNYDASIPCFLNRNDLTLQAPSDPNPRIIEFSPETVDTIKALKARQDLNPKQREPFVEPLTREPLAFVNREALAAWSLDADRPVIFLFQDHQMAGYGIGNPYRLGQYLSGIKTLSTINENEHRIVVSPTEPALARRTRADRRAISAFLASFYKKGYATLEALVSLSTGSSANWEGNATASMLHYALARQRAIYDDLSLLKMAALASPPDQANLLHGAAVKYGDLNSAQKSWANELLFNADSYRYSQFRAARMPSKGGKRFYGSTAYEVTEVCANGIPNDTLFSTQLQAEDALRFKIEDQIVFEGQDTTAAYMARRGQAGPTLFQTGNLKTLAASLDLPPVITLMASFREEDVDPKSPWKPYSELPESMRKSMDEIIRKYREKDKPPPKR